MIFDEKFKEIKSNFDKMSITLIGKDGIIVSSMIDDDENEDFSIELSEVINSIENFWEYRENDDLEEQVYYSKKHSILIRKVSDFYFIILIMEPEENIGKARFAIRKNLLWLQQNIQ